MLPKVTEQAILENLAKRYDNDLIYTYIGPVTIAMNPYRDLKITGEKFVTVYHGHFPHENPPHIYALAEEAYRSMKSEGENQCILISGESGAGKTETAKIIMGYISLVTGGSEKVEYVKKVVLESNPLLEAFGNAKTLRNNNSSRFGKYFEIQFDINGDPCGGKITNYLLEKSRVIYQQDGERNFHFFYNLLAGANEQEIQKLTLYAPEYFYYVNQGNCFTVDGMNDIEDYAEVRQAMTVVGMSAKEQQEVLGIVAGILHIGNITFVESGKGGNASVADSGVLQIAASMLQVDPLTLTNALLFRVIQTGGTGASNRSSTYNVPQNPEQASGARDALAKEIYSRLFDWIVDKVNVALQKYKLPFKNVIGILDIYGFEIFNRNGFEQFCINYVNEKLQQYFIELTLKAEQEEYVREGIKWTPIKYFNNQIVCELIEGKAPPGIFSLLDDICYTIHAQSGNTTDKKFLEKLSGLFGSHPHFRPFNNAFQVKHYAGDVTYEVDGFSDKNKDTLFNDLIETIQCSGNSFLVNLFPENTKSADKKKRPTTAGFKIKTSAGSLMQTLSTCHPHYVRCIKPNDNKKPREFNEPRIKHQVQYLGLLENVRVRRAGFAYRAPYERFLMRYKKLSKNTWGIWGEWSGSPIQGCDTICKDLQLEPTQFEKGKTKIFIRHPETLFYLEEMVERKDFEMASKIQKSWKKWKLAKTALEQRARAANLLRGNKERQRDSMNRQFVGDYMRYDDNYSLQEAVRNNGGKQENSVFSDQIVKLNRRNKPERRDFIMTDQAFYVVMRAIKNQQSYYKVSRRTALADIGSVSLSTLCDNYIVLHIPKEYDHLMETPNKTEFLTLLVEKFEILTGRKLPINFQDNITYKIKSGDTRELSFSRNQSAQQPLLKKAGRVLKVEICDGLPKDTDTTPSGLSRSNYGSGQPARGRGGPSRGRGGPVKTQQIRNSQPADETTEPEQPMGRSVVAQRGGSGPQRGGPVGPQRGGSGPQRGGPAGPQRGGPAGPQRGGPAGPQRGGSGPQRGALPTPGSRGGNLPNPPPKPAQPSCIALYDYDAQTADELSFKAGQKLLIVQKDPGGWWEGDLNGKKGWIPANYVKENV